MVPRRRDQNTKKKIRKREREKEIERPCGSENCDSLVCVYIETASLRDKDFFSYLVFGLGLCLFILCFNLCFFLMLNWIS